jgi:hypothetical protein
MSFFVEFERAISSCTLTPLTSVKAANPSVSGNRAILRIRSQIHPAGIICPAFEVQWIFTSVTVTWLYGPLGAEQVRIADRGIHDTRLRTAAASSATTVCSNVRPPKSFPRNQPRIPSRL